MNAFILKCSEKVYLKRYRVSEGVRTTDDLTKAYRWKTRKGAEAVFENIKGIEVVDQGHNEDDWHPLIWETSTIEAEIKNQAEKANDTKHVIRRVYKGPTAYAMIYDRSVLPKGVYWHTDPRVAARFDKITAAKVTFNLRGRFPGEIHAVPYTSKLAAGPAPIGDQQPKYAPETTVKFKLKKGKLKKSFWRRILDKLPGKQIPNLDGLLYQVPKLGEIQRTKSGWAVYVYGLGHIRHVYQGMHMAEPSAFYQVQVGKRVVRIYDDTGGY